MEDRYTLLFQKGTNSVVNSYSEWGIVCVQVPFKVGSKIKDVAKRTWPDEHGEDSFIPSQLKFDAYDAEFEFAYKGQELSSNPFNLSLAMNSITNFKNWLTGNDAEEGSGAELKIYSPYSTIGRQGCYLLEFSNEEPHLHIKGEGGNNYNETVLTFKAKFRVTDPMTDITLE